MLWCFTLFFFTLTVFGGQWVQQDRPQPYSFLAVGVNSPKAAYASALTSVGSIFVKTVDNGANWTIVERQDELLSLGCGSLGENEAIVTGVLGKAAYTLDGGQTWKTSLGDVPVCQSVVHGRVGDTYGAAGGSGMAVSYDKGVTFTHYRFANLTRYGAVPTNNTWFVTTGAWAEDDISSKRSRNTNSHLQEYNLNARVKLLYNLNNNKYTLNMKPLRSRLRHSNNRHQNHKERKSFYNKDNNVNFKHQRGLKQSDDSIWGEIWKTVDGGNKWTRVYSNTGNFYFNAIDCCDELVCYAVAEGDSDAGSSSPGARILTTSDGGNTWSIVFWDPTDGSSLMGVHCLSSSEAWAAGGTIVSNDFHGDFYHTNDSGSTWVPYQTSSPVLFMDMSNDGKTGIATGLNRFSEGVAYGYID